MSLAGHSRQRLAFGQQLRFHAIRCIRIVLPNVIPDFKEIAESVGGESVQLFQSSPASRDAFISCKR
jgi:hypothetical protein